MQKAVFIGTVFPEPGSTAAGRRMQQLVELFLEQDFKITFLSAAAESEFTANFNNVNFAYKSILLNDPEFESILKQLEPEIVVFDRFITEEQFGWKVAEAVPEAVTILDTEDLHFLRKAREKAYKDGRNLLDEDLLNDTFSREMASILRCDLSLIISEFEMNLLTDQFKINQDFLFYMPLFAAKTPTANAFDQRNHFMSIGNFLHEPNWQTVLKLKQLWPHIRKKIPTAELHVYGAYVTEKARNLHSEKDGFLIKGRAEDLNSLYNRYRLMLAPIPYGAGIKGKLLESMAYGLPNITTSTGAEGMSGNLPWNGYIEDVDEQFAAKAVALYKDAEIWKISRENGFSIVERRFREDNFKKPFFERISSLRNALQAHRNRNFLGKILRHHTLQSTKYLGKWIEEKNRRF